MTKGQQASAGFAIGIDLGTTNSVLAYAPLGGEKPQVALLPIPQLVSPNTIEDRHSLPSFLYLATQPEAKTQGLALPWEKNRDFAVGELARRQSAEIPHRTVSGAKSWLCYSRVDRHQPLLPWNAPDEVPKISPVAASRRYLEHLVAAWETAHPDAPIADQIVVLTVPASFDASARELTREAALAAGLPENFVLLEEPQASVYAWLASYGDRWRRLLAVDDTLLVCDVGGGTTDLTLVRVTQEEGELALERMAVGRHILLGGDNMDLALAHHVARLFAAKGIELDPWQSISLWHSCREAKEAILSPDQPSVGARPEKHPISVLGRGSKLVGGTVSIDVDRPSLTHLLLEGFFPHCAVTDRPARQRTSGFQEIGLPFESDTAVTRHVAAFLQGQGDQAPTRPTHVLFNGGVFKAAALRDRLMEVLGDWFSDEPPDVLAGEHDLDFAVSRGAAYYAWTKHQGGVRIRGGTARAYYVGIETAGLAVPGAPRPLRAVCVVPMGMEEGTELDVPSGEIGLVVGEPAQFRFFSSQARRDDKPGDVLPSWTEDQLAETDSLEATLPAEDETEDRYVPVRFHSKVTELGMLELWCVSTNADKRWKLEFSVRDDDDQS
jgi:hypothetical protein